MQRRWSTSAGLDRIRTRVLMGHRATHSAAVCASIIGITCRDLASPIRGAADQRCRNRRRRNRWHFRFILKPGNGDAFNQVMSGLKSWCCRRTMGWRRGQKNSETNPTLSRYRLQRTYLQQREVEAPAEPRLCRKSGSAGASPSIMKRSPSMRFIWLCTVLFIAVNAGRC